MTGIVELEDDRARCWLLHATGLGGPREPLAGLLDRRRLIQLDPLDPVGCNADLVAMARTPAREGELFEHLWGGRRALGFEHYAKERCLLPHDAFPVLRGMVAAKPGWRQTRQMLRLSEAQLDAVEAEVRERGPVAVADLGDHGRVDPLTWSTWKGTARAATMAAEVLVLRCRLVVCGRSGRGKVVDVPERALPAGHGAVAEDALRHALEDRVAAMGLMPTSTGPWWGGLHAERDVLVARGLAEGWLELVGLSGSRRRWLAPAGFRERIPERADGDGTLRILGPLDPLLWDRWLVQRLFDFEYVWEVYKPASQRRWGWYVTPLLLGGKLVGRFEGRRSPDGIDVLGLWPGEGFDRGAFETALADHGTRLRAWPAPGRNGRT